MKRLQIHLKMCFSCSRLVIPDLGLVKKTRDNFEECSKFMYASFPPVDVYREMDLNDVKNLLQAAEKNNCDFLKLHFLQTNDDSYRPYKVDSITTIQYAGDSDEEKDRMTNLAFLAQYQLRYVLTHFIHVLEKNAAKKRERRLQYKKNKREKKLQNE